MRVYISKGFLLVALIEHSYILNTNALPQNKSTHHVRRSSVDDSFFKNQKAPSYRSFQPISVKYHKTSYPRADDRPDYDITSYDTEYGGVVSNFTSSIYDDNPPLYPNPEFLSRSNQVGKVENKPPETEVDLPDDSLADADLKEHNIIDSVTYLYGFNNCHVRNEWMILIFIACGLSMLLVVAAMMWLMWSEPAAEFRRGSKLYPININLCCCLAACTLIYVQAAMGVSSPSQCERIALLLHYTYLCCAMWIVALAAAVAEYCACDTLLPLKYNYLLAYGVPAVVVMFNYALSMEHYEIKHYCWMSIEKGMVMGFMVPAMILILINTAIIILGLQSVNKKQAEMLTAKIQELVDHHIANWPKNDQADDNKNGSMDTLNIYTPGSSRKNTDSSDTLEREYNLSEDDCGYANINLSGNAGNCDVNDNDPNNARANHEKSLFNMLYSDNLSWKWSWNTEGNELKTYLHLCLVLEPFFAINWVMGVVAIENAAHWSTPTIYLILVLAMYTYLAATICTTMPIVRNKNSTQPCCEDVMIEPTALTRTRTTDSIPLLDPAMQQPNVTPAPADTISTISI
ncbi:7 transmembrane receptor (Secretin family) domain-containing protein [Phthorimaea operculella]|nr:7 transmembrane receptor (Secretin family) domain-containing protein [Phthorimaea operculella]